MTNKKLIFTKCLRDSQISFLTPNDHIGWYPLPQTWLSPIKHSFKFLLGVNFIRSHKGGLLLIRYFFSFFKRVSFTPTLSQQLSSELIGKLGGTYHHHNHIVHCTLIPLIYLLLASIPTSLNSTQLI